MLGGREMKISLDCLPCYLRQALKAARLGTDNTDIQAEIMKETIKLISDYDKFKCSPEIVRNIHNIVKKYTGNLDPYKEIKRKNISDAQAIYPLLKQFLSKKEDRLYWTLKIAATGNIIDYAVYHDVNIEKRVMEELKKKFAICDIERLKSDLKSAESLLIIGDNAGETVFDRVLIEDLLHLDITYAVRSEPIINDATIEDARLSGLDCCTRIISTGCNTAGLLLDECSDEFLNIFNSADIVISKGQGNYESLSEQKREIYFLLKAKCPVISMELGVEVNDYVFKWNGHKENRFYN